MNQAISAPDFFDSKEVEWNDQRIYISGSRVAKAREIKWGVKTAKTHLFAEGDDAISIQSGNREITGTITLLKGAFDILTAAAIAAGGRDITDIQFDTQVAYRGQGTRALQTVVVSQMQISEYSAGMSQGQDHMEIVLPYLAQKVFVI